MDFQYLVSEVYRDLDRVATAGPNERLPKEEQIRACLYALLRAESAIVCAEHGYTSIDDGGRSECDLWLLHSSGDTDWIELKTAWAIAGWNNKPPQQVETWRKDLQKLASAPKKSYRYLMVFGFFDFDATDTGASKEKALIKLIARFFPKRLVYQCARPFQWPNGSGITHAGAWIWQWQPGDVLRVAT